MKLKNIMMISASALISTTALAIPRADQMAAYFQHHEGIEAGDTGRVVSACPIERQQLLPQIKLFRAANPGLALPADLRNFYIDFSQETTLGIHTPFSTSGGRNHFAPNYHFSADPTGARTRSEMYFGGMAAAPLIHPYCPAGGDQGSPAPRRGVPWAATAPLTPYYFRLHGAAALNLPREILTTIQTQGVDARNIVLKVVVQNMPWEAGGDWSLRAHYHYHTDAPRIARGGYNADIAVRTTTFAIPGASDGISVDGRPSGHFAEGHVNTHTDGTQNVVASPNNFHLSLTAGGLLDPSESYSFYSLFIHGGQAVVTLHNLLNDADYQLLPGIRGGSPAPETPANFVMWATSERGPLAARPISVALRSLFHL